MIYWRDQPYGKLCQAAIEGRVRLVCGGPNCVLHGLFSGGFPKPNAPLPVRGRAEDLVWGTSHSYRPGAGRGGW